MFFESHRLLRESLASSKAAGMAGHLDGERPGASLVFSVAPCLGNSVQSVSTGKPDVQAASGRGLRSLPFSPAREVPRSAIDVSAAETLHVASRYIYICIDLLADVHRRLFPQRRSYSAHVLIRPGILASPSLLFVDPLAWASA